MEGEPVIDQVSMELVALLRDALIPGMLTSSEDVAMAAPYQEERDFRLGLYLYDIQDFSNLGSQEMERVSPSERRLPPKAVELHYLVFCNQSVPFSKTLIREEGQLLEGAFRAVYDASRQRSREGTAVFSFLKLSEKISLWQSFSRPLQAGLYVSVAPVRIPSDRILLTPQVRSIDYTYRDGVREEQRHAARREE